MIKYRLLRKGEVYKKGDQWGWRPYPTKKWIRVNEGIGKKHDCGHFTPGTLVRRPINQRKRQTRAANKCSPQFLQQAVE
jgi:hypothetical protein